MFQAVALRRTPKLTPYTSDSGQTLFLWQEILKAEADRVLEYAKQYVDQVRCLSSLQECSQCTAAARLSSLCPHGVGSAAAPHFIFQSL